MVFLVEQVAHGGLRPGVLGAGHRVGGNKTTSPGMTGNELQ